MKNIMARICSNCDVAPMEKSKKKAYKKMVKKHSKALRTHAKNFCPWDYCYGFDILKEIISYYLDYYELGYNVWQTDETGDIVLESLRRCQNAIQYIEEGQYEDDSDHYKTYHSDVLDKALKKQEKLFEKNKTNPIFSVDAEVHEAAKDLFNTIADFSKWWWD